MRRLAILAAVAIATGGVGLADESFRFESIGDHVHLARPIDPGAHRLERFNSLIVDLGGELLVAEPQPTPAAARQLLAAIETRWPEAAIRYLVLPYPTAASTGGAEAYPESTLRIAAARLIDAWEDPSYDRGAELRVFAEDPEGYEPPPTRTPDLVLHGRFEIRGKATTVVLDLAQDGYSRGGLVVNLPGESLYYAGALIDGDRATPLPFVGDTGKWASMLNQLIARDGEHYVGRQGDPLDKLALRRYRDGVAWVRGQVEYGFVKHVPVEELPDMIVSDPGMAERFALEHSPDGGRALVDKTIDEVLAFRRTRGMPDPGATTRKQDDESVD